VVAGLLVRRGFCEPEEARAFLNPKFEDLHSPYLMRGMKEAVERLQRAIANKEPVLIYGDYDVDGTMATVILKTAIELLGGVCDFHVPHRLLEGYGMRDEVIERAAANGVRLIISVDTGIRAFAEAETAKRVGVDLIVTDHHLTAATGLPDALAVLNPNDPACGYPSKGLCGAGVAFKLAQALLEAAGRGRLVPSFLKVVAIATVADSVPLLDENRVFARLGLEALSHPVNPGLKALLAVAELNRNRGLSATEVAFRIAPRMNAAGRMHVARDVVDLFTVRDELKAREIAERLNRLNAERQQEEARITAAIYEQLEQDAELREAACVVVAGEGWHRGVIGICASRVVERCHRPALVIAIDGEEAHGSGRSIWNFHLLNAIEPCADLFIRHGGHAAAVGFALRTENIPELRRRAGEHARQHLSAADLEPMLEFDAELALADITPVFWEQLSQLEPFGNANPEPVFVARDVETAGEARILKEKHLKLRLKRNGGNGSASPYTRLIDALGWRMAERLREAPLVGGDRLDVAFRVERNNYSEVGGQLQLVLCDYRNTAPAAAANSAAAQ
jgi:single-stranded-DNA-specific exonuclease